MKNLYKNLLILLIFIVTFILIRVLYNKEIICSTVSISTPAKDRLEAIKEKGILTVASSNDPPTAFIDPKTKKISGMDAEIITEIAKRLGINKVELVPLQFKELLEQLNSNDNIDLLTDGMFITDERQKKFLFTDPWYVIPECIVIQKFSNIVQKEDFKNATIAVQKGTVFNKIGLSWKEDGKVKDIKIFNTLPEIFFAVNNKVVDAALLDCVVSKYNISNNPDLFLKILSPYEHEVKGLVAAIARKSDTTLVNAINEKLVEMKDDGTLFRILKKYDLEPYESNK